MKCYTFSLIFALLLTAFFLGCQAENPVCTDSFCFVGEAFPREDLDTTQPYSEIDISEADIDIDAAAVLAAIREAKPVVPQPVEVPDAQYVSLQKIVNNAAAGRTKFVGETVKFEASVNYVHKHTVQLATNNPSVFFLLVSPDVPERFDALEKGRTYKWTVSIYKVVPPDEGLNAYKIWGFLERDAELIGVPIEEVSLKDYIADLLSDSPVYTYQRVKIRATVIADVADNGSTQFLRLETRREDVEFWVYDEEDTGELIRFESGKTYTFTLLFDEGYVLDSGADRIYAFFIDGE